MAETLRASCYLRLEPTVKQGRVTGFKVSSATQGRPRSAENVGSRLVKLNLVVPTAAFSAIEATMEVPAEFVEAAVHIEGERPR